MIHEGQKLCVIWGISIMRKWPLVRKPVETFVSEKLTCNSKYWLARYSRCQARTEILFISYCNPGKIFRKTDPSSPFPSLVPTLAKRTCTSNDFWDRVPFQFDSNLLITSKHHTSRFFVAFSFCIMMHSYRLLLPLIFPRPISTAKTKNKLCRNKEHGVSNLGTPPIELRNTPVELRHTAPRPRHTPDCCINRIHLCFHQPVPWHL